MRKRMRNGADPRNGSVEIKCGTERIWIKSPLFLRFRVLDLCFFCNGIQRRSAYYS
jgi:hypothetical protein